MIGSEKSKVEIEAKPISVEIPSEGEEPIDHLPESLRLALMPQDPIEEIGIPRPPIPEPGLLPPKVTVAVFIKARKIRDENAGGFIRDCQILFSNTERATIKTWMARYDEFLNRPVVG